MILWLNDWLNKKNYLFSFDFPNWMALIISVFVYNITFKDSPINLWVVSVPIVILSLGVLNYPYCYLKNRIKLEIVPRMFKKRFYILCDDYKEHGDFQLSNQPDEAVGMLVGDLIYLDEEYDFLILWGMKDNIRYFPEFKDFLQKEIVEEDSQETIKRKLILKNLTT